MNKPFLFFIFFLIVFDLQVPFLPNGYGSSLVVLVLLLATAFLRSKLKISGQVFCALIPLLLLHLAIALFVVVRLLYDKGEEFQVLLSVAKSATVFLAISLFFLLFERAVNAIPSLIKSIFLVNALICFVAGSIPPVLDVVRYFQFESSATTFITYRNSFLSGSGFFSIGSAYGLATFFIIYTFMIERRISDFRTVASILLIFAAGFVAARVSMIGFALSAPLLLLRNFKIFVRSSFVLIGAVVIFLSVPGLDKYNSWLFEFFSNGLQSSTLAVLLQDMYFIPDLSTFVFGDGKYGLSGEVYYGGSDVGYMRNLFFGGIPYVTLLLTFPMLLLLEARKHKAILCIGSAILICAFHAKGAFIYNNAQGMSVFYAIYLYVRMSKGSKVYIENTPERKPV
ncbi:hypothetical protein HU742_017850 [Pseudomonas sp. SWRI102]|uniref:Uncharacterized protein n=1 Tax=Pseudomonas marvdashtae TaxID=2745500 RepID=A0A923FM80_9PSED|nr:hypothetical protein [Pseudomonas marvdashtae]MBV4553012.1 hypothetical protein [Pseudomonas marvdashtae]